MFCLAKCSKCCVQLIAAVTFLLAPVFVCARTHTHTGGRGDSGSSKSDCARAPSLLHLLHLAPWGSSPVTSAAFDRKVHTHTLPPPRFEKTHNFVAEILKYWDEEWFFVNDASVIRNPKRAEIV